VLIRPDCEQSVAGTSVDGISMIAGERRTMSEGAIRRGAYVLNCETPCECASRSNPMPGWTISDRPFYSCAAEL